MTIKIYKIINIINDKIYVGQTSRTIQERFYHHCYKLYPKNKRSPIQKAILKYGKENFSIHLLEELPKNSTAFKRDSAEKKWILKLNSLVPNGYNIKNGGQRYWTHSKQTKLKIGRANTGKVRSQEVIEKLRIINTGRKHTKEFKRKMSKIVTGRKHTEKTKEKISKINKGRKPSIKAIENSIKTRQKTYTFKNPEGIIVSITNVAKYSRENNLNGLQMNRLARGKRQEYLGWTKN